MRVLRPILAVATLCAGALFPATTMAHGGETGIDAFPWEVTAGGEVTVFGEELEAAATMQLHLLTPGGEVLLAEPITDELGHFSETVTLPANLAERVYEMRLTMPDGQTASAYVTIVASTTGGAAASSESGESSIGWVVLAAIVGLVVVTTLFLILRPSNGGRTRARRPQVGHR